MRLNRKGERHKLSGVIGLGVPPTPKCEEGGRKEDLWELPSIPLYLAKASKRLSVLISDIVPQRNNSTLDSHKRTTVKSQHLNEQLEESGRRVTPPCPS